MVTSMPWESSEKLLVPLSFDVFSSTPPLGLETVTLNTWAPSPGVWTGRMMSSVCPKSKEPVHAKVEEVPPSMS